MIRYYVKVEGPSSALGLVVSGNVATILVKGGVLKPYAKFYANLGAWEDDYKGFVEVSPDEFSTKTGIHSQVATSALEMILNTI